MSAPPTDATTEQGVLFRAAGGKRSSTAAGKAVLASAVEPVDGELAGRIRDTGDWRKRYVPLLREVVAAGLSSGESAHSIAQHGLAALDAEVVFVHEGQDMRLTDALRTVEQPGLFTAEVKGEGSFPGRLQIPYGGRTLEGPELLRRVEEWREAGVMEASAAGALQRVVENPEWLDLSDLHLVLVGAASQMGPLEMLSAWKANIIAIDLPRAELWETILKLVRKGSGRCYLPMRSTSDDLTGDAGVDLLSETPRVLRWLEGFGQPAVVGNYVYADGARFVLVAAAADALFTQLGRSDGVSGLAYLATPTDVFAVPDHTVEAARVNRRLKIPGSVLRPLTLSKTFAPNYAEGVTDHRGRSWGLADSLVPIQGPNYALAKSSQRWRALLAKRDGILTSANVAPSTRTSSVIKNRMLAAAYRGAGPFGIEIFEPATSRAVMAALLVHDLRDPDSVASPTRDLEHPYELFSENAVHGGLWRSAYEPRSVLPLALLLGLTKRH